MATIEERLKNLYDIGEQSERIHSQVIGKSSVNDRIAQLYAKGEQSQQLVNQQQAVERQRQAEQQQQRDALLNKNVPSGMEYKNGKLQIKEGYEADPVTGFVLPTTQTVLKESALDDIFSIALKNTGASYLNIGGQLAGGEDHIKQYDKTSGPLIGQSEAVKVNDTELYDPVTGFILPTTESIIGSREELYEKADKLAAEAAEQTEKAKEGKNAVEQFLIDAGIAGVNLAGDIALNTVAPGLGWVNMAARGYGSGSQRARLEGATGGQQFLYGLGAAGIEVLTEKLSSIAQPLRAAFGKGLADGVVDRVISKLTGSAVGQDVLRFIASGASEGVEEMVGDVLEPVLRRATYDEQALSDYSDPEFWSETIRDGLVGGVLGLAAGSGSLVRGAAPAASQTAQDASNPQTGLDTDAQQNAAPAQPESVQTGAVQADAAVPSASTLDVLLSGNVTNSVAERIVTDPQLRAEFEQRSGIKLEGSESQMRNAVRSYAEGDVGQFRPETAADDIVEADVDMPPVAPNNVQYIQQSVVDNAPMNEAAGTGVNAVGAAERGFSPAINAELTQAYEQALDRYGAMPARENLARQMDVPRSTDGETVVPRTVQSAIGSDITSAETVGEITKLIAQHGLDRAVITDRAAQSRAQSTISEKGWDAALRDWTAEVRSGKVSKDLTTLGLELYNNAVNSGHAREAVEILTNLADSVRSGAQSTQVMHLLQKLTPQGQLYGIQRTVQNLQDDIDSRYGDISSAMRELERERDAALNIIAEMHKAYTQETETPDWITSLANDLAGKISASQREPRQRTIYENILSDLVKFTEGLVPKKQRSSAPRRTAAERLADYFNNTSEYDRAWSQAIEAVREKYSGNETALEILKPWLESQIGSGPVQNVAERAVVEAAAAEQISKKQLNVRAQYDINALTNQITNSIVQSVGDRSLAEHIGKIRGYVQNYLLGMSIQETNIDAAEAAVRSGVTTALRDIGQSISGIIRQGADTKAELANIISQMLTEKYGISGSGAAQFSDRVISEFNSRVADASKKALDNIFKDRPARTRKTLEQRLTELGNLGAFSDPNYNALAAQKLFGRFASYAPNLQLNEDLVANFLGAETDAERASALDAIYQDVANQMPVRWIDKLNAWRYLSMLGNPRTHVRNILGNLMFAPVRTTKDVVAAGLEAAFIRDPSQRTKAVNSRLLNAEDRARYAAAVADYAEVADMISSGGKFQNDYNEIRSRQRIFKNDLLEAARVKNSELLDAEDVWFSKPAYASALSQYLKAQGITAEQYLSEGFDKTATQAYAVKEAQKAVYRDYNAFSDFVSGLGKSKYKAVRGFVEGVLPFKRTPANILARGMEYSPFGLAKGIYDAIFNVRNGKMTAAEAIDSISSGLTGTGLLALGAMLAAQGLLSGGSSGDEKQDAFDEMRGAQNYALTIGNRSYTLDWLAPEALPLFVGVEMYKAFGDDSLTFSDIWQSLNRITDPMFEMSMLSGVNDLLDSVSFVQDTNTIWPLLASAATSYLSQYIPTLFGQIERTFFEDTRQSTYTDKDAFLPTDVQYAMSQAANKLPGVEYQQVDYIDAWGRKESTGSLAERAFNNFLNPAYVSKDASTSVDDKLQAIYDATGGEYKVFPERVTMNTTVNGEKFTDPEVYEQYATALGQKRLELVEDFFNSSTAEALTPQQQGAIIEKLYDYAKQVTQQELMGKKPESSVAKAEEYGDPAEYFLFNEALQTIEDTRGSNMAAFNAVMEDYENMSAQRQQALMEALGEGTRFDDVVDAYQSGIQPNQWYKAYSKWQSIGEGDGSANDKATEFANWLDSVTNYSAEQSELLQDQMIYYTMIRGNSDRYDELRDLGFTPAESIDLYEYIGEMNKLSSDTDAEGNTISGSKKAKVIDFIDTLDLTPDEKDLIFSAFTNYKGLEDTPWHNR